MGISNFRAMIVDEEEKGLFRRRIKEKRIKDLPPGEVLIRVLFSSLNYKDALSATGNRGVTRSYPHTPGIDAAGVVEESSSESFSPGDEVLVTGYDLGMNTPGGFGQYVRVPAGWVVPRPEGLSLRETMSLGTAGFTAGLSVHKILWAGVEPDRGKVLVTGASGGVGSMGVGILAKLGFEVVGVTGKKHGPEYVLGLGAREVVSREEVNDLSGRHLLEKRWAAVLDTVGGNVLSTVLRATDHKGAVTTCGNVGGAEFKANVYPFILRGICLLGIDSAHTPMDHRRLIWSKLAGPWKPDKLDLMTSLVGLDDLDQEIDLILKSGQTGRKVVDLNG